MKLLYIGQHTDGTTSRMRADQLGEILNAQTFDVIDTHVPFFKTQKLFRSLGFRYKMGPLVWNINSYVQQKLSTINYDLIWVDKGIFLDRKNTERLRKQTKRLVHFTPDMAFFENKSSLFNRSISLYDFLITTKSEERELYLKHIESDKLIMTTQGFDGKIHCNVTEFKDKRDAVSFVGLWESYRELVIQNLINKKIKVLLAGKGWHDFVKKNKRNPYLEYFGDGLFSHDYARFISSTKLSLGLMSKRFPELHTTRTFEIPACGTALLTERNTETSEFFTEDEVIFFNDIDDMICKIDYFLSHPNELENLSNRGLNKVIKDKYDYESILGDILRLVMA
ncbi:glycosyltransferase [Flavobacteriaceae bacterium F89]|uniref:Glycosyltransferase n=1 Tax=Cerina litoralis TaxID=2874477 RepID=A0AAE3EXC0_9FLAO|nr:glycosyltransferase [Cerina litoralis]MCG2462608.1 glycosyltransferase [Cerina litoralis]